MDLDGAGPTRRTLKERFRGAFLGCMLGDAVGRPLEMISVSDTRLGSAIGRVLESTTTLRTSDDTEMMFAVAESIVRTGDVSRDDLLATLAANYDPSRGYGHGMKLALEAFRRGDTAAFAAFGTGSKGNGGAVRVVPIACAFHHDVALLAALAEEATGATHAHPTGRAGGVAHAVALAHVLGRTVDTLSAQPLLDEVLGQRAVQRSELAPKLEIVRQLVVAQVDSAEAARELGNGVLADEAVPLALFCFLRWRSEFNDVVRNTLMAGGDTDTIAAMSGALCGALVGEAGLPPRWLDRLEAGTRGAEHARALADSVFGLWAALRPTLE